MPIFLKSNFYANHKVLFFKDDEEKAIKISQNKINEKYANAMENWGNKMWKNDHYCPATSPSSLCISSAAWNIAQAF